MGFDPELFWKITLRTYAVIIEATQWRLIDQHNERVWLAWHIAALGQTKKLPKLGSLMMKYPRKKRQTVQEQHHIIRMIANTFGGKG